MKRFEDIFDNAVSDLLTINWSETDGSDVKKILRDYFKIFSNYKYEIIKRFEESLILNKFQKTMIKDILLKM